MVAEGVRAKPFEPRLVIGAVRELLAKKSQPGAVAPPAAAPARAGGSNDYFDRLDQAFATLGAAQPASTAWDVPSTSVPDLPLSHGGLPDFDRLGELGISPAPPAPVPAPPIVERAPTPAPVAPPQAAAPPPAPTPVPQPAPPAAPVPAVVTQELVDRVASRVLEQLSDRVVRESVAEIVSAVAERLVRESVADTVSAVAERLVRERIADTVSAVAERLVKGQERRPHQSIDQVVVIRFLRNRLADPLRPSRLRLPEKPARRPEARSDHAGTLTAIDSLRPRGDVFDRHAAALVSGSLHVGHVFSYTH